MADVKVTKANVLAAINAVVDENVEVTVGDVVVTGADIKAYVDTTLAQLEKKAEKARERAAEKKVEGDELRDRVAAILTEDNYVTIAEIVTALNDEDVTPGKVTARLTQLCKAGLAHKIDTKQGDRKVKGYAAGPASETEDAE